MKKLVYEVINGDKSILETFVIWHFLFLFMSFFLYFYMIEFLINVLPTQVYAIMVLALVLMLYGLIGLSFFSLWRCANKRSGFFSILTQGYVMISVVPFIVLLLGMSVGLIDYIG